MNITDFSAVSASVSMQNIPAPSPSLITVNTTLSSPSEQQYLPHTQPPSSDPTPLAPGPLHASTTTDILAPSTNRNRSALDMADPPEGPSKRKRKPTEKAVLYAALRKSKKARKGVKGTVGVDLDEENEWEDI